MKNDHEEDKISGKLILDVLKSFGSDANWILSTFQRYGIPELNPNKDYSVNLCIYLIDILKKESGINTVFKLGFESSKIYKIPTKYNQFKNPHEIFPLLEYAYKLNVKTYESHSYYYYEKNSDNQAILRSSTPFHCEFEKGFITGILYHYFNYSMSSIHIDHSPELACKNFGSIYCNFLISW